ncbi:MAG: glycerol-3-phosphate 1-O-acyltransferase PlsY [Gemmatimonadota bacterium]|nr:glycerol-3-phosphate 1-O-acyltransferase PlsY [Gemmatimonadota bacterium]
MTTPLFLTLAAYAAGAVPSAFWVGRFLYGKDLRTLGSCNLGATNVFRVLGWRPAAVVMVADVFKGFAPVWWFPGLDGQEAAVWPVIYGAAAIVGHVYSFWVGFKGGKGVATSGGVLIAMAPMVALAGLGAWLLTMLATRTVSVASMAAALAVGILGVVMPDFDLPVRVFLGFIAVFVIWAHRSNIRRLLAGTEPRVGGGSGDDGGGEDGSGGDDDAGGEDGSGGDDGGESP